MKSLISVLVVSGIVSVVSAGTIPTADTFNWTLYDDFADATSYENWTQKGISYNTSTYFGRYGKMVMRSYATMDWNADAHFYASIPDEDVRGIKADISITNNEPYTPFGYGRNVVGIKIAPNLEIYMGFFSSGYTQNIQVGYRLDGQNVIPDGWSSQAAVFGQVYETAIVLDDSGRNLLFFLDNQLFEMVNIYPASIGVQTFFTETYLTWLQSDFAIDNFHVLTTPEPATLLLLGLGGVVIRRHALRGGVR